MADVFVSYAKANADQARAVVDALTRAGYSVWIDAQLPAHRAYGDVIADQIRAARAVLVLWSPQSVASQWVRSEADRGRNAQKLVQLMLEPTPLPMPFDQIHCIDLSGWQGEPSAAPWRRVVATLADLAMRDLEPVGRDQSRSPSPDRSLAGPAAASGTAQDFELRQVSVLVADIDGLDEALHRLDPETAADIQRRAFDTLAEAIESVEGFVEKTTSGGLVGLFGVPRALEDHPQRACYAALRIRDDIARLAADFHETSGIELAPRIGLNSGEILVGFLDGGVSGDYSARGKALTEAYRLQAVAPRGACLVSAATARLVEGYVTLEPHAPRGAATVPGQDPIYRLEGLGSSRTRLDVSRKRGLLRFVGREAIVAALDAIVHEVLSGQGQVVGIVGEAGTGKSRLCAEFLAQCRARGMQVFQAGAPSHGRRIPYLTVLEVLRAYVGIERAENPQIARGIVETRLLALDPGFASALPLLFDFMGIPDPQRPVPSQTAQARRAELVALIRHLVRRLADEQPIVTLIEDLHWLDPASAELLAQIIDPRGGTRSLLLVNSRPTFQAEWMREGWYRQIPLPPLDPKAIAQLLAELLGDDPSVSDLPGPLVARSGGNPFFLEELVLALAETGQIAGPNGARRLVTAVDDWVIPDTVQAVLAGRIDTLKPRDKRLLQLAAVIGRDFAEPVLAAVTRLDADDRRSSLKALQAADFIYETAIWPVASYAFKHAMTQDVALASQTLDRRRKAHAAVAQAIEAQNPDAPDAVAGLLATHWSEAREPLRSAQWWLRAARSTQARFEAAEALVQVRYGLAELGKLAEAAEDKEGIELELQVLAGNLLMTTVGHGAAATAAAFERALELTAGIAASEQRFTIEYSVNTHFVHRLELARALELCDRMLARADAEHNMNWRFVGLRARGPIYFHMGRVHDAAADFEVDIQIWRSGAVEGLTALAHDPGVINVICYHSYCQAFMGATPAALAQAALALREGRQSGHHLIVAQCLFTEAVVLDIIGRHVEATPLMQAALDYAIEHDVAYFKAIAAAYLGTLLGRRGDAAQGLALVTTATEALTASGSIVFVPDFLTRQGELMALDGRPKESLALFEQGLGMMARSGSRRCEPEGRQRLARALRLLGRDDDALAELAAVRALAHDQAMHLTEAGILLDLAPRMAARGEARQARDLLDGCLAKLPADCAGPTFEDARQLAERLGQAQARDGRLESGLG